LAAVVAWVTGIYLCQLFGLEYTLEKTILIGVGSLTVLFLLNTLSAKLGGYIQNIAMIIKLIPLMIIAIAGFLFGNPGERTIHDIQSFRAASGTFGWLAAFAPIAFSFDGWIVATSICHEIKNSRRNLPLALMISPLIILIAYVAYFVGISALIGPDKILEQGDASVFTASKLLFGNFGAKAILIFVIISVLGTVNGLSLAFIRMPYSLALRNMVPGSAWLKKENEKLGGMPLRSAVFAYVLSLFWMAVHYISQKLKMRGDVSEIAIGVSYLNYIVLYFTVMKLTRKGILIGKGKGYIIPVLAAIGSLVILSGSITHPLFIYYFAICLFIMLSGYLFYRKNKETII
jgi:APA family basic amino acid/polyamine antiporter